MFRKIRNRFILLAMIAISLVVAITATAINIVNYSEVAKSSDSLITTIYEREKEIPNFIAMTPPSENTPKPGEIGDNSFFIAKLNEDGSINIRFEKSNIITEEKAKQLAKEIFDSNQSKGYLSYYRFDRFDNEIIFLDCTNALGTAKNFLIISLSVSAGSLGLIFMLIYFASGKIFRPIEDSYNKQNEFITNASHSLKTPLTIISANTELIELKDGESTYTKNISDQVDRMNVMVKTLTSLSKISEYNKIEKQKFLLSEIIEEINREFTDVFNETCLEFETSIEPNIYLNNDPKIIKQLLNVVYDNARKYAKSKVSVTLSRSKYNKRDIELVITNDCEKIEQGDLIKFTERFYRTEHAQSTQEGSGIGLSIFKELCERAKIEYHLTGQGDNFIISMKF